MANSNSIQPFYEELLRILWGTSAQWALLLAPVGKGGLQFRRIGIALVYPETMKRLGVQRQHGRWEIV